MNGSHATYNQDWRGLRVDWIVTYELDATGDRPRLEVGPVRLLGVRNRLGSRVNPTGTTRQIILAELEARSAEESFRSAIIADALEAEAARLRKETISVEARLGLAPLLLCFTLGGLL